MASPATQPPADTPEGRAEWCQAHGLPVGWLLMRYSELQEIRAEIAALKADRDRLDWLSAHPLPVEIKGGTQDGSRGTFWGIGSATMSLRQSIDVARDMGLPPSVDPGVVCRAP